MTLKQQLQKIIDEGVAAGLSPIVMERAIVPSLIRVVKFLKHSHYYVWQGQEKEFVVTVLEHRFKTNVYRKVIFAFPTAAIAESHPDFDPQTMSLMSVEVAPLIFQILTIPEEELDSLIFFNKKGNTVEVKEVDCKDVKTLIQDKVKKLPIPPKRPNTRLV
ncbi:MAG: hypothetical protein VKJ02_04750 [Snowella sp.]|nr:hypothetical protein [Snowella sp.]